MEVDMSIVKKLNYHDTYPTIKNICGTEYNRNYLIEEKVHIQKYKINLITYLMCFGSSDYPLWSVTRSISIYDDGEVRKI